MQLTVAKYRETRAMADSTVRIQSLREYERIHLNDMADAAQREVEIIKEIYTPKSERIKKYAESLAERVELKDPMLDITEKKQISGYISRKYREHGVSQGAVDYVREVLDEEYKREYERETIELGNGTAAIVGNGEIPDIKKPVKQMDNLELQETDDMLSEKEKKLKAELARVRDIKEMVYETAGERHFSVPSQKETVISTPKPEASENEFAEVILEISNCLVEVANKVTEFPPNPQDAQRYAEAGRVYLQILKPLTDLKFTKDTRGRFETIKTFEEYGKHAAAVKNAIQTPSGVNRPLTREQVGDMALEVLEGAIRMYNTDPFLVALAEHHRKYKEPYIGDRKHNLHDRLSERA